MSIVWSKFDRQHSRYWQSYLWSPG